MQAANPRPERRRRSPAPSIYAIPVELQLLAAILTPRSRDEFKRLPLDALPPHAGPALVFDVFDQAPAIWRDDWSGRTLSSTIELDELVADQLKLKRTAEPMQRATLAKRIRRRWVALVDHAIGYRVPGTLDVLEFA